MARGMINEKITSISKNMLGYEISQKELRLMPYILDCLLNNKNIDTKCINQEEEKIISNWQNMNFIKNPTINLSVSKEFYNAMFEIVAIGYVDNVGRFH